MEQQWQTHQLSLPRVILRKLLHNKRLGKFFDKDRKLWDKQELENNFASLNMDYDDILTNDNSFFQTLYNLNRYGLTFVNNIPTPQISDMTEGNATQWPVYKIAEKFGYIKKTFYGTLFDVKNKKEKATNIAYTNTFCHCTWTCSTTSHPGITVATCYPELYVGRRKHLL